MAKFGLHASNMKFNMQNEECINTRILGSCCYSLHYLE